MRDLQVNIKNALKHVKELLLPPSSPAELGNLTHTAAQRGAAALSFSLLTILCDIKISAVD